MTSLAAMRTALGIASRAVADAASLTQDDFALWPPVTAPHGPSAARTVAQALADTGHHSHLVADGEVVCLSGCGLNPGQVLL